MLLKSRNFGGVLLSVVVLLLVCIQLASASGVARWIYRYARSGTGQDRANDIVYGTDGNIYVAGYSAVSNLKDWCVISLTTTGDTNWVRNYDGAGSDDDEAMAIVYGDDGNLYIAGYSTGSGTNHDFAVLSMTTTGDYRWSFIYDGPASQIDEAYDLVYGDDDTVYVVGYSWVSDANDYDITVMSIKTSGDTNWVRNFNGPGSGPDIARSVVYGDDNYLYVTGAVTNASNNNDFVVGRFRRSGVIMWNYRYDGSLRDDDIGYKIVYGGDGNLYAAGYSSEISVSVLGSKDFTVMSLITSGDTNWVDTYDGGSNHADVANSIVYGGDNYIYATGYTTPFASTTSDIMTRCYKSTGAISWTNMYDGPGNGNDSGNDLVYGSDGNLYTAGCVVGSGTGNDFGIICYQTTTGSRAAGDTIYTYTYDGPASSSDEAICIVYGDDDNIYAAGYSSGIGSSQDLTVISLRGPTMAVVSSFDTYVVEGKTLVEWQTSSEVNTIGFHLLRKNEITGEFRQVNNKLLTSLLHSPQGGVYRYIDETVVPGKTYTYKLVEVESNGRECIHGPFTVKALKRVSDFSLGYDFSIYSKEPHQMLSTDSHCEERSDKAISGDYHALRARNDKKFYKLWRIGDKIKIMVADNGFYYVSAQEIADLLGVPVASIIRKMRNYNLVLSNQGEKVAYVYVNGGIYFYGQKMLSVYTEENVYWLTKGKGLKMDVVNGTGPPPASGDETFSQTIPFEDNNYALTALFDDPYDDFWFWDYIIAGDPEHETKAFDFAVYGVTSDAGSASLTLCLQGVSDTDAEPDHHVKIELNGVEIGESHWDGLESHTVNLIFNQDLLNESENSLQVTGILDFGVEYSVFYVNDFDVTYHRLYQAVDNLLFCEGGGNPVITISEFSSPDIYVFDITNPLRPRLIRATTIDHIGDNYRVSFRPESEHSYLALTHEAVSMPNSLIADLPSSLKSQFNRADYIIITPLEFKDVIKPFAQYRNMQGYITMVVSIEDIMDEFNYGVSNPEAIQDFLSYTNYYWNKAPRYVLLVGNGNYDYKDYLGYGDNLMPTLLCGTEYGLFASDNLFVYGKTESDVPVSDVLLRMVIGRLPVVNQEELQDVIDKIIAYENASGSWLYNILMLADNPELDGNFTMDSDDLASLIPPNYYVEKIYLGEHPIEEARQMVLDGINEGAVLMNYFGHSGLDRLAQEGLLMTSDVGSLNNGEKLPIMTAMSCVVGRFEIPGYNCLSEAMLLKGDGGAIATWVPTGLCFNADSKILAECFYSDFLVGGEDLLGDAVLRALEAYKNSNREINVLYLYNLLGDPVLLVR